MTIFKVADETGASVLMLMDDIGRSTKPGDILLVLNGYVIPVKLSIKRLLFRFVPLFDGQIRIACKFGAVIRTGHFTMQFKEIPDLSAIKWSADPDRPNHWNKEVIDLKRPRSRTKITLERARKDPRLQKQQRAPDQSALQ